MQAVMAETAWWWESGDEESRGIIFVIKEFCPSTSATNPLLRALSPGSTKAPEVSKFQFLHSRDRQSCSSKEL